MHTKFLTLSTILFSLLLSSCQQGAGENNDQSTEAEPVKVPYSLLQNYFVKNTLQDIPEAKIETEEDFQEVFGAAATMAKDGKPTTVDFEKQFIIACILPKTEFATQIEPISLEKNTTNELIFTYAVQSKEKQTFSTQPFLALIVDKKFDAKVVLNEEIKQ